MGIFAEYLKTVKSFDDLALQRRLQLQRIATLRKSDVLVIAGALGKPNSAIENADLIPIADQLDALNGDKLDVILETPGGSGEATEDIVRLLRRKHKEVNFIVPGTAKSAGTIMVMSGDEILMGAISALGPIDAQVARDGKFFSAEAFLEGLERIKEETDKKQSLNRAYIPILQAISPGEIEAARNALKFGKTLATKWLSKYKFSHWEKHSDGRDVTPSERENRAGEIAEKLGSHSHWLSHGRSIKQEDLVEMGIRVTNYETNSELSDAIRRYHILLKMVFETNVVKVFETPSSKIYRFQGAGFGQPTKAAVIKVEWKCPNCGAKVPLQANFGKESPIAEGSVQFPKDNLMTCPKCSAKSNLTSLRLQLEAQTKQKIL